MFKKTGKIIAFLFFLSLVLRLAYIFTLDNAHVGEWDDVGWEIAKNIVEGKGYTMSYVLDSYASFRPPVFPLFLTGIFFIFGKNILIARIFIVVLSSLQGIVVYFLGKRMFDQATGMFAMAVFAVYPAAIYWSGYLGPETLSVLFLSLAVLVILASKSNSLFFTALAGVFLGLLSLSKSMFMGLAFLFFLWLVFSSKSRLRGLIKAGTMTFFVLLFIFPWAVRNYKIHHSLLLSSTDGGVTFYSANNPETLTKGNSDFYLSKDVILEARKMSEIESDRFFYKKGLEFIKDHPRVYFRLMLGRAIRFWRFYPHITGAEDSYSMVHVVIMFFTDMPIILLGLLGLFFLYRKEKWGAVLLGVIFAYLTLISMLVRGSIRYRAPIMPFLIILASYMACVIYKRIKGRWIILGK